MSAAGLQEGVAQDMHVNCVGGGTFYGRFFHCDKHHGVLNISQAIPLSCDTFFYALAQKLGLDGMWIPINGFCGMEEEIHPLGASYQDEWGVTYIKNGWPIMAQTDTPIKTRADWEKYRMPSTTAPHRFNMLREGIKANSGDLAIKAGVLGPFTMMYWYLMDIETLALTIHDDPDLVREMCDAFVKYTLETVQGAKDLGGVSVVEISDDWGGTKSLLMSPKNLREFFIPPFRAMVQGMRQMGLPLVMHGSSSVPQEFIDLVNKYGGKMKETFGVPLEDWLRGFLKVPDVILYGSGYHANIGIFAPSFDW